MSVPHREDLSDTCAYRISGPRRRVFYCPDIDRWDAKTLDALKSLTESDLALLDGTFFSPSEIPGRNWQEIPHPFVSDSAKDLALLDCQVFFLHLNHTNPLWEAGPELEWLAGLSLGVARQGDRWEL